MKERILEVRKHFRLSQDAFGKRLSITGASVSRIESGENNPSEQTIRLICSEFGVDRHWLLTGAGDPYIETNEIDNIIDVAMAGEKETAKAVFKALARYGDKEWELLKKLILDVAREIEQSEHMKELP